MHAWLGKYTYVFEKVRVDGYCDERAFLAAIRAYELQEGSAPFAEAMELWRQRHGSA